MNRDKDTLSNILPILDQMIDCFWYSSIKYMLGANCENISNRTCGFMFIIHSYLRPLRRLCNRLSVCLICQSVCLFVSEQHNSKTYWISFKSSHSNSWLSFGDANITVAYFKARGLSSVSAILLFENKYPLIFNAHSVDFLNSKRFGHFSAEALSEMADHLVHICLSKNWSNFEDV